jgi:RimJ/RimL family protein N-acetyltransferase
MDPLLIDIPEQIVTDRLIIRGPRVGDGAKMNEAIRESIEELRPWMPWAQTVPTPEESESNARKAVGKFITREDLRLHVFLKDGTFVAGSGLHRLDWAVPKFEIGYWLRTSHCGKGYMTEAVRAIGDFAFSGLKANRVEIRCDNSNDRSCRVADRAGFQLEGILRNDVLDHVGKVRSTRIYSRIPD